MDMDVSKILYGEISFVLPKWNQTSGNQSNNNNNNNHANASNNHNNNTHTNHINNNTLPEEFQAPKIQLCDPNQVQLGWLQSEKIGGGLINVGNTCFLNSVLQCLTYCPPLYNFLVKHQGGHSQTCKLNHFCMLCEMERLIKRIRSSNGAAIKPSSIVQRLKYINKSFQFGRQEDAHEFLRYLIDHMWKACLNNLDVNSKTNGNSNNHNQTNGYSSNGKSNGNNNINSNNHNNSNGGNGDGFSSNNHNGHINGINKNNMDPRIKETTFINHIFGGYHRSQVLCLTCNSRSNTFDYFMDLILDIRNAKSLEEALKRFTQAETLQNENAYKCSKCRKKVVARKKFTVHKAPNVATFQLKRFDSDRIFGGKVTKFISYPVELDLRPYMSDPNKSPVNYLLSAVLVHTGHSSNSGHYFCFIRNSNNFWYRMDDSQVSLVTQAFVLQQQAYVLFYTRKSSDLKHSSINGTHSIPSSIAAKPALADVLKPTPTTITSTSTSLTKTTAPATPSTSTTNKPSPQIISSKPPMTHNNNNNNSVNNNSVNNNSVNNKPRMIASTIAKTPTSALATWHGSQSKLDEDDLNRKKANEMTGRDRFNEELDQGKIKKIKARNQNDRFNHLSKHNPFQRYTSNGYQQFKKMRKF